MEEPYCPRCETPVPRRRLVSVTETRESCPDCLFVLRRHHDAARGAGAAAQAAEDVPAVEAWLAGECESPGRSFEAVRGGESSGRHLWRVAGDLLAGRADNFALEVAHDARVPGLAAVRAVVEERGRLDDATLRGFADVFLDHAAQLHEERRLETGDPACGPTLTAAPAGWAARTRWGAVQYLDIAQLRPGALRPVAVRLLAAVSDALVSRRLGA